MYMLSSIGKMSCKKNLINNISVHSMETGNKIILQVKCLHLDEGTANVVDLILIYLYFL